MVRGAAIRPFFEGMDIKIKLNIKAMMRFELMTGKPFQSVDYANNDDMCDLLYCAAISDELMTKEEFKNIIESPKKLNELIAGLKRSMDIVRQFIPPKEESESTDPEGKTSYIKEIASTLIVSAGLNPQYVLNEMDICELPVFIEAYEAKKHEEMEAARLWTFYNVLPHVDTKKMKSPKNLIVFPWEVEERKKEAEEALMRDKEAFEKFMKGDLIDLSKIKWNNDKN